MSSNSYLNDKWNKKLDKKYQKIISRVGVDRKTLDQVFDKSTLNAIEKLISDKVIDILDFPISTGKEGNVFLGFTPSKKRIAVKIYRTSNSTFRHISNYIVGDPRFKSLPKNHREIIFAWTQKEFKNLERLRKINVSAPKPITCIKNVLVMQYIGDKYKPAPLLKDVKLKNPEETFKTLIDFIKKMYKEAELVHCDLSPYNILMYRKKPYLIDLGQGVLIEHVNSLEFLHRDIENIVNYFKKYNIKSDSEKIYKNIIK